MKLILHTIVDSFEATFPIVKAAEKIVPPLELFNERSQTANSRTQFSLEINPL